MLRTLTKLMLLPFKIVRRLLRRRSFRTARTFGAGMVTGAVLSEAARRR